MFHLPVLWTLPFPSFYSLDEALSVQAETAAREEEAKRARVQAIQEQRYNIQAHREAEEKKRKEAKAEDEKIKQGALDGCHTAKQAQEEFDAFYRGIMEKVAQEGLASASAENDGAEGDTMEEREERDRGKHRSSRTDRSPEHRNGNSRSSRERDHRDSSSRGRERRPSSSKHEHDRERSRDKSEKEKNRDGAGSW